MSHQFPAGPGRRPGLEAGRPALVVAAYAVCAVAWGTTWYAIRRSLPGFPPAPGVAIRFLIAAAVFWGVLGARRHEAGALRARWKVVAVAGLLNATGYALVYEAERRITGGLAAVLFATMPLVVGFVAAGLGVERLRLRQVAGALVGVAGVGLLFRDEFAAGGAASAQGVGLVLASVGCASLHSVLVKRYAPDVGAVAVSAVFATVTSLATFVAWPLAFRAQTVRWDPASGAALLYLALVGTVLAFGAYFYLLRRVRVTTVATLSLLTPVVALALDALGGERTPSAAGLAGAAVVLAGVALTMRGERPSGRPG